MDRRDPNSGPQRCLHCTSTSLAPDYLRAFQLPVCVSCARNHEELVSGTNAKQLYSLTDRDLKSLPHLERPNPRNKSWAPTKMYLVRQIQAAGEKKHGGLEGLAAHRQRMAEGKVQARLKRKVTDQEEERGEEKELERIRIELEEQYDRRANPIVTERRDEKTGRVKRKVENGAEVEVEEI